MKRIIIDLDDTICISNGDYANACTIPAVVNKISQFKSLGYEIVIHTSRNMRTFDGNVGKINVHTLPIIIEWLRKNNVEFDEIVVGKPWCGHEGFYIDDRAIRPNEFVSLSPDEISELINQGKIR